MKTGIGVAVCLVIGIVAMQVFLWAFPSAPAADAAVPAPTTAPKPAAPSPSKLVASPQTVPLKPSPPVVKTSKTSTPTKATTPAKPSKPPAMYFTTHDVNKVGIPGRVIIHNLPTGGTLTILILRDSAMTGELYGGKGKSTSAGKEYAWEVRGTRGGVTVTLNGKNVPPK